MRPTRSRLLSGELICRPEAAPALVAKPLRISAVDAGRRTLQPQARNGNRTSGPGSGQASHGRKPHLRDHKLPEPHWSHAPHARYPFCALQQNSTAAKVADRQRMPCRQQWPERAVDVGTEPSAPSTGTVIVRKPGTGTPQRVPAPGSRYVGNRRFLVQEIRTQEHCPAASVPSATPVSETVFT